MCHSRSARLDQTHAVRELIKARRLTMAVFFVLGFVHASWSINVSTVRDAFTLDSLYVSLALLALAAGGIISAIYLGKYVAGAGTGATYKLAGIATAMSAALILLMPTYTSLLLTLFVFGLAASTVDIAMNAEAAQLERAIGHPIMSRLHGICSVGGMAGGLGGTMLMSAGFAPSTLMVVAASATLATLLIARGYTLQQNGFKVSNPASMPKPRKLLSLWTLGAIVLIAAIAEGAMCNWSTIYMRDVFGSTPQFATLVYAAFCGGLAIARLRGDWLRVRVREAWLIAGGGGLACSGMLLAVVTTKPTVALIGLTLTGCGLANIVPAIFAKAAQVQGIPAAESLARVAGMGYVGVLLGPALVGGVAQFADLRVAFLIVAICCALLAVIAALLLRKERPGRQSRHALQTTVLS